VCDELSDVSRAERGNADGLGKVVSGAGRHDRESAGFAGADDRVCDPTDCAVAANRDNGICAGGDGVRGEGFLIARGQSFEDLVDPARLEGCADLRYRGTDPAAAGGGINDQTDLRQGSTLGMG
jgi:hypothetical protein